MGELDRLRTGLQGNILDAYRLACVRHVVLEVADRRQARAVLSDMLRGDGALPQITSDAPRPNWHEGPCVNVGITYEGLAALGVPGWSLRTFPPEFRDGMAARAGRLGDVGTSRPECWAPSLRRPEQVHVLLTVHAQTACAAAATADHIVRARRGAFVDLGHFDGEALVQTGNGGYDLYNNVGKVADDGTPITHKRGEHFGFRDGFSQPRFEGVTSPADRRRHDDDRPREPYEPLGVVLLGHPTRSTVDVPVPQPDALGRHGTFNAFRVLGQDVAGFRAYIRQQARQLDIDAELLEAKICGRRADGSPLATGATGLNDFDFSDDQDGRVCPVGSHIRRTNPRAAQVVQRPSNRSRRLVRRGMPFGPWLPADETSEKAAHPRERGLLGNFLCASLSTQFEAMQYDWINLGLQDPSISGSNDPLVGANGPGTAGFAFHVDEKRYDLLALPRFVETIGGAYCFLPSLRGLRWIADGGWRRRARA